MIYSGCDLRHEKKMATAPGKRPEKGKKGHQLHLNGTKEKFLAPKEANTAENGRSELQRTNQDVRGIYDGRWPTERGAL
jgi:hypothetical protein